MRLRSADADDALSLIAWCDSQETWRRWADLDLAWPLSEDAVADMLTDTNSRFWIGVAASHPVGVLGIGDINQQQRRVMLRHILVAPEMRGQGIGAAMTSQLLDQLFGTNEVMDGGLHRVSAEVVAGNEASIAMFHRLGFTQEGIFRQSHRRDDGIWDDVFMFGLLNHEWHGAAQEP